ncbi:taste receptor type 2 member 7-like [Bos indicus x Bos taurus]|uniref:Taste receptor type 2 n=1 Tax=Bos taurus TaxID=9913 RepID=Q2ABB9_BOVIN|nr:bitter taste receptor Bota-T2R12 [Bos taurus]XP_019815732.1 PREDICTED: taste receptor type 2 member 7-like [Bos indicus]XP_027399337.1 taste receptor type 2 member 7-like [Bos indicus x Bos taurus]BAE80348.1 bitter taste receptor [Bos taurus]DAA29341.1 TPA: bitter taste receptor Bota-T2R12 [Bos taurus]
MERTLNNILTIIYAGEFLLGILGNGFIVLVNCIDWIRSRKFSLIDFILTCLAISRICVLCIMISSTGLYVISKEIRYNKNLLINLRFLWTGSNYFSIVCTTCISVFYLLRIANFSNFLFLWMKWRIHKVLLIIALGAVFSFCLCLLQKDAVVESRLQNQVNSENNVTLDFLMIKYDLFLTIMFLIPFVVSLASFLLLILSLCGHLRRMNGVDCSSEAHVRALKAMISFLLLFVLYYLSTIITVWANHILGSFVAKIFVNMLLFFCPSGHTLLLILWNSKLKQASLCVLRKLKGYMNLRKPALPKRSLKR